MHHNEHSYAAIEPLQSFMLKRDCTRPGILRERKHELIECIRMLILSTYSSKKSKDKCK